MLRVKCDNLKLLIERHVLQVRLHIAHQSEELDEVVCECVWRHEDCRLWDIGRETINRRRTARQEVDLLKQRAEDALACASLRQCVADAARLQHRAGPWAERQANNDPLDPAAHGGDRLSSRYAGAHRA
eukprot:CAMPEP_0181177202 /NCGR_PEP_ID=MMETSP1096-20121128/5040_2 /TAXON_ID=156174 ORGANISM="Chrysochromulina ericina, Strain CCMP281" /NCGR_SAMPLE_ID=MMETSP1096 /ASSEMBLY_ACC=CAM_ASM_000453 /LENGTH=128 /DNA_ID=CAMNT_0023265347 /DNA_START=526 /DNA_END=909 /DNA_ORIENTATION=-